MAEKVWKAHNLEEMTAVAQQILANLRPSLLLFKGEMGAGKTTLIKALCKGLGVEDAVSSPTFSLVNEYAGSQGEKVFHFDWYRLEDEEEAWEIGFEEYLSEGDWLFMEWPEKISNLLPSEFYLIRIEANEDGVRTISLNKVDE